MNDLLYHTAQRIVVELLIDLGLSQAYNTTGASWPTYYNNEPDEPDQCITVYSTQGTSDGRLMSDGEVQEHYGILMQFRSTDADTNELKARAVATGLDSFTPRTIVTISPHTYQVINMSRSGNINYLGRDRENKNRFLHTINYLATIVRTS